LNKQEWETIKLLKILKITIIFYQAMYFLAIFPHIQNM